MSRWLSISVFQEEAKTPKRSFMKKKQLLSASFAVTLIASSAVAAKPAPPKHRIAEEKAQSVALKEAPGTVESHELEHEHGKWVYSFDIRGNDKQIHEVQVDA